MKVLIVDDQKSRLTVMRIYLRHRGHEVLIAEAGDQALLAIEQNKPDVMVTDYQMPGMNGVELVRAVRKRGLTRDLLPIFGSTGDKDAEVVEAFLQAGANDVFKKSVEDEALMQRIDSCS